MKNIDETEGRIGFYEVDEDEVCDDTLKIPDEMYLRYRNAAKAYNRSLDLIRAYLRRTGQKTSIDRSIR